MGVDYRPLTYLPGLHNDNYVHDKVYGDASSNKCVHFLHTMEMYTCPNSSMSSLFQIRRQILSFSGLPLSYLKLLSGPMSDREGEHRTITLDH